MWKISDNHNHVLCELRTENNEPICKCEISIDQSHRIWQITRWFTRNSLANQGFGRRTLQHALQYCKSNYGKPETIQYTWNGTNAYVLEWLEKHFDAVCTCPIAVQKTQADDDKSSHIYELNKDKVFAYFTL